MRLLDLLIRRIVRHADEHGTWPAGRREHRAENRAREIPHNRFAEDVSPGELARSAGLSPLHLIRVFEGQLGITPYAYLTRTRVECARQRLAGPASAGIITATAPAGMGLIT